MKFNLLHIAIIITILQSLFLAIIFLNRKNRTNISNRLFALILFIFAILVVCVFTQTYGTWSIFVRYHKIVYALFQLSFLAGPLIYFYSRSIIKNDFVLRAKDLLHLIPFFAASIYLLVWLLNDPAIRIYDSYFWYANSVAILAQSLIYLVISLIIILRNIALLKKIDRSKFIWLRIFIFGYIVVWIAEIHAFVLTSILRIFVINDLKIILYSVVAFLFIYTIAFTAFRRPEIFLRKYQKSRLTDKERKVFINKLVEYMEDKKPYLNPSVTISDLSQVLCINTNCLSQIINETFNLHFYDFINSYRVRESQQYLKNFTENNMNILQIAYEVGFNSKSAFNRAFKKHTGQVPSEYKNHKK